MNIGICIAGAACMVRKRVIIPAANRNAATLTTTASQNSPTRSTAAAGDLHPGRQRDREDHRPDHHRPHQRGNAEAGEDRRAVAARPGTGGG